MTHPTDHELEETAAGVEAMATVLKLKGLNQASNALDEVAAILRASKCGCIVCANMRTYVANAPRGARHD